MFRSRRSPQASEGISRQHVTRSAAGIGHRMPPGTWRSLIETLKALRPACANDLEHLDRLRRSGSREYEPERFSVPAQEKDAIGVALDMAGLGRSPESLVWAAEDPTLPAPFIRGLKSAALIEDLMVGHDARVFPAWSVVRQYQVGAVEFGNSNRSLTVVNVNRTRIEKTLGVDLVYYHHNYRSFVLVQYKRMLTGEGRQPAFRPANDDSYRLELQRMLEFEQQHSYDAAPTKLEEYRLHRGPFYFKLCPSVSFEPLSSELIRGMYLPLDYWQLLMNTGGAVGPRGGWAVTYDSAGRHLHNTMFTDLVGSGWIGSRLDVTTALEELVAALLEAKHSVVLAEARVG